jgi:hypothetical protein
VVERAPAQGGCAVEIEYLIGPCQAETKRTPLGSPRGVVLFRAAGAIPFMREPNAPQKKFLFLQDFLD